MPKHIVFSSGGLPNTLSLPTSGETSKLLVLLHGGANDFEYATGPTQIEFPPGSWISTGYEYWQRAIDVLTRHGFAVLCPPFYDTSLATTLPDTAPGTNWGKAWGNDVSTTSVRDSVVAAKAMSGVSSSAKIGIMCISMANITAFNFFRRFNGTHPLAGILGVVPIGHMQFYYDITSGALQINEAYDCNSTTFASTIKPTYDTLSIAPSLSVPYVAWTNSDDTAAPPDLIEDDLIPLIPGGLGTFVNRGTGGHTFVNVSGDDLLSVFNTWSWS